MATFTATLSTAAMDRAIQQLGREHAPKAMARALNRALTTTRAVMARNISSDTGIKTSTVKEQLRESKATPANLSARITVSGKPIPLIDFRATQTRTGVTARMPDTKRYPGAFIATMGTGHTGVFKRVPGKTRRGPAPTRAQLPIYELHGPSLPKVFGKFTPEAIRAGEESLAKNLASEIAYALQQSST